jgi:hypothetical protein
MPPQMVRSERVADVSLETENTSTVSLPVILSALAPGPSITSGPAVSVRSNVVDRVIDNCVVPVKTVGSNSISLPAVFGLELA